MRITSFLLIYRVTYCFICVNLNTKFYSFFLFNSKYYIRDALQATLSFTYPDRLLVEFDQSLDGRRHKVQVALLADVTSHEELGDGERGVDSVELAGEQREKREGRGGGGGGVRGKEGSTP